MRRVANWAIAVLVALAALVGLIAIFESRDESQIDAGRTDPGTVAPVAGPGSPYTGDPPLSPALEDAVARGNVVVLHRDATPPAGTQELVPAGGRALEAAGQAVLLEREPTLDAPLAAVAKDRIMAASSPQELEPFVDYWLGGR